MIVISIGSIVAFAFGAIWSGYVFSILWAWFLMPTLGAPALSIPAAIGVLLAIRYITMSGPHIDDKPLRSAKDRLIHQCTIAALKPLAALGLGAVVKMWM